MSGGDSYYLQPEHILEIGNRLLSIPHVRRFRFATKGLAVCPSRVLDSSDPWTETLVYLSSEARKQGKQIALHTHFNHPAEITWVSRKAAQFLFERNVIVRNQSVLLRGVNDDVHIMKTLIRELADMNIQPVSFMPLFPFFKSNSGSAVKRTRFSSSGVSCYRKSQPTGCRVYPLKFF